MTEQQPPPRTACLDFCSHPTASHHLPQSVPHMQSEVLLTPKSAPMPSPLTSLPGILSQSESQSPPVAHKALQDPPVFPLCPLRSLCSSHTSLPLTKTLLPQGLCTCYSVCLECFPPRIPQSQFSLIEFLL